jgi:hypothetical protein
MSVGDIDARGVEYDPLHDPTYQAVRTMIGFCQGIFKALPNARYRWSPDDENTQILITGAYPLKAETLNRRPAIVVGHSQTQIMNTSLGSFETQRFETGNNVYRDLLATTIVFNCVATTGHEASSLAWFVASNLRALRPLIQRLGPFTQMGQEVSIGIESPPGALLQDSTDTTAIAVPVMAQTYIPHRWEVLNPAYQVDAIRLSADTIQNKS